MVQNALLILSIVFSISSNNFMCIKLLHKLKSLKNFNLNLQNNSLHQ